MEIFCALRNLGIGNLGVGLKMKRKFDGQGEGVIASLFRKHEAKAKNIAMDKVGQGDIDNMVEDENQEQESEMIEELIEEQEPSLIEQEKVYDIDLLPHDPGKRMLIANYHVNDQDAVRRAYILKGPCQPYAYDFLTRNIGGRDRHFSFIWFHRYTNELSQSLQKRDQDIINAMSLVSMAKSRMQHLRSHGWEVFIGKVTSFCNEYGIQVPKSWDDMYVPHGRSSRFYPKQSNDDHFRREVYLGVVDQISQELESRFDEVNMELLVCMSALNPFNSFASFDVQKLLRLAKFYPNDISNIDLIRLEIQLENFIDDMRRDDRFKNINSHGELSIKLVETQKHVLYDLVYLLLKLVLILPVATASVERVFSAMCLVKTKLRNSMGDRLLNNCMVTFIERDIFSKVSDDEIIGTFMAMRKRKVE